MTVMVFITQDSGKICKGYTGIYLFSSDFPHDSVIYLFLIFILTFRAMETSWF